MSLDAVERQAMPFVGETGGVGAGSRAEAGTGRPAAGSRRAAAPIPASSRPARRGASRKRAAPRIATTGSGARPARTGCSGDRRSGPWRPRPGRRRHAPGPGAGPDRRPTTCCSASGSTSTSRASSTATSGPADLKAQVDMEQLRAPPAARGRRRAARTRPREVTEPDRRTWLTAQLAALETHAAGARRRTPLPYAEHVERCMGFAPPRRPDARVRRRRRRSTSCCPATGRSPTGWRPGTARSRSRSIDCRPSSTGSSSGSASAPPRRSGCPRARTSACDRHRPAVERLQLVRRRPALAGRHQHRPAGPRPDLVDTVAHETYPGHHLEHAWKEADLVDRPPAGGVDPAHQHARMPDQRGPGRPRRRVRRPAESGPTCSSSSSSARAWPWPPTRRPARRRSRRSRWPPRRSVAAIRGNAAFLRHADGGRTRRCWPTCRTSAATSPEVAAKRLEFIEHPLWRTYVFVYAEGEALLRRWVDAVPPERAWRASAASSASRSRRVGPRGAGPSATSTSRGPVGRPARPSRTRGRAGQDRQEDAGEHRRPGASVAALRRASASRSPVSVSPARSGVVDRALEGSARRWRSISGRARRGPHATWRPRPIYGRPSNAGRRPVRGHGTARVDRATSDRSSGKVTLQLQ